MFQSAHTASPTRELTSGREDIWTVVRHGSLIDPKAPVVKLAAVHSSLQQAHLWRPDSSHHRCQGWIGKNVMVKTPEQLLLTKRNGEKSRRENNRHPTTSNLATVDALLRFYMNDVPANTYRCGFLWARRTAGECRSVPSSG